MATLGLRARVAGALLIGTGVSIGAAMPAAAVQSAQPSSRIVAVQLIAEDANQSYFQITIDPRVGSFSTVNNDPTKPELILLGAGRAADFNPSETYRGLVRSVRVDPTDTGLSVKFTANAPAKAVAERSGNQKILVTLTRLSGAEAIGSRPVDSAGEAVQPIGGLPPGLVPLPGEDGYELVMLKYADVSEIVGLLTDGLTVQPNNVFIRREPGFGSVSNQTTTTYSATQGQAAREEKPLGQSVDQNIAIDRRLNAIWIKGSPDRIQRIKDQIALIDVPVDSVILETQFVELTEQGARNVGIDLANASGQIAQGSLTTGSVNPFNLERTVLPNGTLQAAIYAQIQKGEGRIVSKPRIVAQSGSTAKIITGDALPILTAITLSGVNGVSQQVQYVNVGVTLQIAPRVSSDGYVTSHIYGVVSSVTGYSQGYPTISQREAETSASVRDGETFVIGGLTQENSLKSKSKFPILGDIPLIGEAFKVEKSTRTRTELYIVITPRIVRHRRFETMDQAVGIAPTPQP